MRIVVFEDAAVRQLEPLTLGRAAYTLQCGSYCLADWLGEQTGPVHGVVRPHLRVWQEAEYPDFSAPASAAGPLLLVNARVVPCRTAFDALHRLQRNAQPGVVYQGDQLAAAVLPADLAPPAALIDNLAMAELIRDASFAALPVLEHGLPMFHYPHDLVQRHVECLADNLARRISSGNYREVRDGLFLAEDAQLADLTDSDTALGPIVVESGSVVKPFACLRGPLYLGRLSRINEHAVLKSGVSVGPMAKVGGEIEASIIEQYANKQHTGYLGHSYLGRWVNWGAGTSNSNLKNTYGTIRMRVDGRQIDTGMQFMGCVMGDFSRTAINTAIFTGKLIGCCSMLYGYVTTDVPSFVNYARTFGEVTQLTPQVMAQTQKRAFLRRGIEQQTWHLHLLQAMYELSASSSRPLADRPVSL